MLNKQLINNVVLNISENETTINANLSIPVVLSSVDKVKIKDKDADLGVISFSEETSKLIIQVGEAIRKELLSKL